jgi:hypothetical protein
MLKAFFRLFLNHWYFTAILPLWEQKRLDFSIEGFLCNYVSTKRADFFLIVVIRIAPSEEALIHTEHATTLFIETQGTKLKAMGDTMNSPNGTSLRSVTSHSSTCTIFLEIRLLFPLFGNYVVRFACRAIRWIPNFFYTNFYRNSMSGASIWMDAA